MSLKRSLWLVLCFFSLYAGAQTSKTNVPRAALSYNAEKMENGTIVYNTSFFIFDFNIPDKKEKAFDVMKADPTFKKVELLDVNGTKDMMVIVEVSAFDRDALSGKVRFLLKEIGVYTVEYNGATLLLDKFNF